MNNDNNKEIAFTATDYETLIENSGGATFLLQESKIQYANKAATRLIGYDRLEDLRGIDFWRLSESDHGKMAMDRLAGSTGAQSSHELQLTTAAGEQVWVKAICRPVKIQARSMVLITLFDITAYRQAVQTLQANETYFRQAVLSISDHIYVSEITPDGRYLNRYISPHAQDLTGYPLKKFNRDWSFWPSQVIHPEDRAVATQQAAQLADGHNSEAEYRMIRADGQIIWVRDSGKVHTDPGSRSRIIYGVVSDITERKRLEERLAAIHQLGQQLNLLRDEAKIVQRVLETIAQVLQVENVCCAIVDHKTECLNYRYRLSQGVMNTLEVVLPLTDDRDFGVATVRQQQSIHLADTQESPAYTFSLPGWGGRSQLCIPMKLGQQVIGILLVAHPEPDYFTAGDRQILQTLADQAATATENAALYQEIGDRVEELASMNMISQAITSSLDLRETLAIIANHAVRLLNTEASSVALHDPASEDLWFYVASGQQAEFLQDKRLPAGTGIIGWVIEHGEPALVTDTSQDSRFFDAFDQQSNYKTHSVLCFPLQTRTKTFGALEVINKKSGTFTSDDMRLLGWLAMPAATAIENARLYEEINGSHKRLQSLSRRLVEVQETERRYVARELHDEAGQALASLMVGLHLLENDSNNPNNIPTHVATLKGITESVLENLHRLAMDLHPASLDHLGLIPALRQYVDIFSRQYGLLLQFEAIGFGQERLPPSVEINLYRIVQEGLTNVIRHAQASRADVLLEQRDDKIIAVVEDNGIGFDPETNVHSGRLGLLGLRERAEMMGGQLEIESSIGNGTTIYVEIPYANSDIDS